MPPLARGGTAWLIGVALASARYPVAAGPQPDALRWCLAVGVTMALAAVFAWRTSTIRGPRHAAPEPSVRGAPGIDEVPPAAADEPVKPCDPHRPADPVGTAARTSTRAAGPRTMVWALALCSLVAFGAARHLAALPRIEPGHIARWAGRTVELRGWITEEPDRRDRRIDYRLRVTAVRADAPTDDPETGWRAVHGDVLLQAARHPVYRYGDAVRVTAELERPPADGEFDYRAYLARDDLHVLARRPRIRREDASAGSDRGHPLRHLLIGVRHRARRALHAAIPEPEASLAVGILLGDARGIPDDVSESFRRTNTTHVIAISGSNIALLVAVLWIAFGRLLGPRRAAPVVLFGVAAYTSLVGADAAVVRAALMGGLVVVAEVTGRPSHAVNALLAAATAMTIYRPAWLGDLGFQLSFAATAGLVAFTARFRASALSVLMLRLDPSRSRRILDLLEEATLVTIAAQLTTLPLIAWHLEEVSISGMLANALIVPVQPAVMGFGAAAAMAGIVWPPLGTAAGALAWLPLTWTIRIVETASNWPLAAVATPVPGWGVVLWYIALTLAVLPRRTRYMVAAARTAADVTDALRRTVDAIQRAAPKPHRAAVPGAWAMACILAWTAAVQRPDGLLHVTFLDVGQGDAVLVTTPNGRRMLIDGGPGPAATLDGLGDHMAPWDRRLDMVLLTHPDADHVGGLPGVLERYRVRWIAAPDVEHQTPDADAWLEAVEREGARFHHVSSGDRLVLDETAGVSADVLWPPGGDRDHPALAEDAVNDHSVVLRLTHGRVMVLLTGDIEQGVEEALVQDAAPLSARVLKLAHHGSNTSSTTDFLAAVRPALTIVSAGRDNRFGHPAPDVLERVASLPSRPTVRRTDRDGAVDVISDGRHVWVSTQRPRDRAARIDATGVP